MSDLLKGNYELGSDVNQIRDSEGDSIAETFEKKALERLGGSIAFVMKGKKLVWDEEDAE